jgi:hypothetical protein
MNPVYTLQLCFPQAHFNFTSHRHNLSIKNFLYFFLPNATFSTAFLSYTYCAKLEAYLEWWFEKDVEASGHSLFSSIIPAFDLRDKKPFAHCSTSDTDKLCSVKLHGASKLAYSLWPSTEHQRETDCYINGSETLTRQLEMSTHSSHSLLIHLLQILLKIWNP